MQLSGELDHGLRDLDAHDRATARSGGGCDVARSGRNVEHPCSRLNRSRIE
jgi:hypothetical protein